jgi:hypothetical protein
LKICPECRNPIPDFLLACMACTLERSQAAIDCAQIGPLRVVEAGEADLALRAQGGTRHIKLFGFEQTFCGRPVHASDRRNHLSWDEYASGGAVCKDCRREIDRIKEAYAQKT